MKTLDECKGIVARKHGFLYWQSVLTSSNVDLLFTEVAELYASQSKPEEIHVELLRQLESLADYIPADVYTKKVIEIKNRIKPVDTKTVDACHFEPIKSISLSDVCKNCGQEKFMHIEPTKTVDAVEFAEWLKVNNHELKLDSGYRSDEHNAKLLNLYKQDIKSKK